MSICIIRVISGWFLIIALLLGMVGCGEATEPEVVFQQLVNSKISPLEKVNKYFEYIEDHPDSNLIPNACVLIGRELTDLEVKLEDFKSNPDWKNKYHMKYVQSENFGDFITYDGYHFCKVINEFKGHNAVEDAEYYMLAIIKGNVYNYLDLKESVEEYQGFIRKYPSSRFKEEVQEQIKIWNEAIENGLEFID